MKEGFKRIIIIGDSGRGKSTLAHKLSAKLNIPYHSTDDYYWEVKFSKVRDRQECMESISKLYRGDAWIVEGSGRRLLEPGFLDADLIIFLKHKSLLFQWWVLMKRHGTRGEDTLMGTLYLLRHVFYKKFRLGYEKNKVTYSEALAPHETKMVVLSSFKEINDFVDSI